jgi:hypothetical protein
VEAEVKGALLGAVFALLIAAPARAQTMFPEGTETAAAGIVSAKLSWDAGEAGPANARLEITRDGAVAFARAIPKVVCEGCQLTPDSGDDLRVADLDGDGEAEVIVTSYTGGQHCCTIMGAYGLIETTGGYSELVQNWASSGFELADPDHDGAQEIVSRDIRFEDLFSSHFGSFPPPAVFEYQRPGDLAPELVDATKRFPALIKRNAAQAKREFSHLHRGDPDGGGFVAAYVADQFLLEHATAGYRELDKQIKRGILGSPKAAKRYRARLLKLLHRYGYR